MGIDLIDRMRMPDDSEALAFAGSSRCFLVLILLLCFCVEARPQLDDRASMQQAVDLAWHDLAGRLAGKEAAQVRRSEVVIVESSNPFHMFAKPMPDGSYSVELGGASLALMRDMNRAVAINVLGYRNSAYVEGYARYLASASLFERIESASAFASLNEVERRELTERPEFSALLQSLDDNCLAFIVAHEMAHIVKKHRITRQTTASESQKYEREADDWAVEACLGIGGNPFLAASLFELLYWMAHPPTVFSEDVALIHSHPMTRDRQLRVLRSLLISIDRNRGGITLLSNAGRSLDADAMLIAARRAIELQIASVQRRRDLTPNQWKHLAQNGNPEACTVAAIGFLQGIEGFPKDRKAGTIIALFAAERLHPDHRVDYCIANWIMGALFYQGEIGKKRDTLNAIRYMERAAKYGFVPAIKYLKAMK